MELTPNDKVIIIMSLQHRRLKLEELISTFEDSVSVPKWQQELSEINSLINKL